VNKESNVIKLVLSIGLHGSIFFAIVSITRNEQPINKPESVRG
jgi:hypothetical protein